MSERINNSFNLSLNNLNPIGENDISKNINVDDNSSPKVQGADQAKGHQKIGENRPDSGVSDYINGNANSSIIAGRDQAKIFAKTHEISSGKDWDFSDPENVKDLVKESFNNIKNSIEGKDILDSLDNKVSLSIAELLNKKDQNLSSDMKDKILTDLTILKNDIRNLKEAREKLTKGLSSSSSDGKDPIADLQMMKKTLRVFRYETQKILNKTVADSKKMDFFEGKLRAIQNFFTFGIENHVTEQDFAKITDLEQKLKNTLESLNSSIQQVSSQSEKLSVPENFMLESTIEDTLESAHRTNDQIRIFEEKHAQEASLRTMITPYAEKGGHRNVEFTAGVGAFFGLGIEGVNAGVRAGARFKVIGEISCKGKGHPIEVTYRIGGGLEAKAVAKFGNETAKTGINASAGVGGEITKFVTRSYPTVEDMILDIERCKLATSRSFGDVIVGGLKKLGSAIGNLGQKFFRFLGRHSGEVMQSNKEYLESLKNRGVINALDSILAKRANPIVVTESQGWSWEVRGEAQAQFGLGFTGSLTANASANHMRDFGVKSKIYVPFARMVTNAKDEDTLKQLVRPGPDGQTLPELPDDNEDIAALFDEAVNSKINNNKNLSAEDWSNTANQIRTLMVATELRCRKGLISKGEADRLLNRMTSPSVKIPQDIFREYLMEGSSGGKPPKIRTSAQVKVKLSVLEDVTDNMTSGVDNVILKAVANGAVKEMRKQAGLDSSYQYVYTSEKPSPSSQDIRPWEKDEKSSHSLVVSNAAPFRVIIDVASKIAAKKGEPPELAKDNTVLNNIKEAGIDTLKAAGKGAATSMIINSIIAGVKEGAKAAVIDYLSKPENVAKLLNFIEKNAGKAFDVILSIVEWVATHPDIAFAVAEQAIAMAKGTTSLIESESTRTVKFNFVNGELESVGISTNNSSSFGVNVDPLGVGVGVGFDVKYSVSESINDRGILIKPTLNTLLSLTESYTLSDTSIKQVENSEALKNYLARNIFAIKGNIEGITGDKSAETYSQAKLLCFGDLALLEKLESSWAKLKVVNQNTPDSEIVDALHDFLMATTRAYRNTLPVETVPENKNEVETVPENVNSTELNSAPQTQFLFA